MPLRGKNLLIRNSSSSTVKLGYTSIHDIEVWTNLPPQSESQGNIYIHDTQVKTKGDPTKPTMREHYYKQKHNKNIGKKNKYKQKGNIGEN
jgi:hypothetical protein